MPATVTPERVILSHSSGKAQAEIYLHGATITSWTVQGEPLLFLSPKAILDGSKAIRGGIPLVFPQFGLGPALPTMQHGFARSSRWEWLGVLADTEAELVARFQLADSPETQKIWPHSFRLWLTVSLRERSLKTELTVQATGSTGFSFTTLLHTYLQLNAKLEDAKVEGLQGLAFVDKVREGKEFTETEPAVTFPHQEVDRVYRGNSKQASRPLLIHGVGSKGLRLTQTASMPDVVVWNPAAAKAKSMADLGQENYQKFICVEVGAVAEPVLLEAGKTWVASQLLEAL